MQSERTLETEVWLREMRQLIEVCCDASGAYVERAIRQAFNLGNLSPKPIRRLLKFGASPEQLEAMLEYGDWSQAARAVVSNGMLVTTSLSPDGQHKVYFAWANETIEVDAKSPLLAMLAAWLTFLSGSPKEIVLPSGTSDNPSKIWT